MTNIAVILTSYNRPKGIKAAINSVLSQTYSKFVLYVMDDNSIDEVKETILLFSKQDSRVIPVFSDVKNEDRLKSCRYAVMINQALRVETSSLVTYLTDDTQYTPERLERIAKMFDDNSLVNVCYTAQNVVDTKGNVLFNRPANKVLTQPAYIVDHNSVTHKKSIIDEFGYWDENPERYPDADAHYWMKISSKYPFFPIPYIGEINMLHEKSLGRMYHSGDFSFINQIRE